MSFTKAVQCIPSIREGYQKGLRALGNYSKKIAPSNTRNCNGSVDLDNCLKASHSRESRWDYIIGYNEEAYFAEVHSASGEVSKVINKVTWLRSWLKKDGASLEAIHYTNKNFHWIPTNGVNVLGKEKMRLAQNKLVIVNQLRLK